MAGDKKDSVRATRTIIHQGRQQGGQHSGAGNEEEHVPGEGSRAMEGNKVEGVPGRAMRRTVCQGGQQGGWRAGADDKDNNVPGR